MKAKKYFLVSFVVLLWALGAVRVGPWPAFGQGPEEALVDSLLLPRELRNLGYWFREKIFQLPHWIYMVRDVRGSGKNMVLMREEAGDEFAGALSASVYDQAARGLIQRARSFSQQTGRSLAMMLVPNKTFANGVSAQVQDVKPSEQAHFGISSSSPNVGSAVHQRRVEHRLREASLPVVSLLDTYDRLRDENFPLYPFGESHWAPKVIEEAGIEVVRQMTEAKILPACCRVVDPLVHLPAAVKVDYRGDLADALGINKDNVLGGGFVSRIDQGRLPKERKDIDDSCPEIFYVGTSFGVHETGPGTIADAMQLAYMGRVHNASVKGTGPIEPLIQFDVQRLRPKAVVIWEFPFRYVKYFGVDAGGNLTYTPRN